MLKIRLQRIGRKHEPAYRLVVTDSKNSTKSGKSLEVIGSHDSRFDKNTHIDAGRVSHWLGLGAKATGTVHNLLVTHKIISGKKINVLPKKTVAKKEEAPVAEVAAPAPAPVAEEIPAEAAPVEPEAPTAA